MKIGLFFGSFNPIHVGHLIIASSIHQYGDLDHVWFVVSPQNPFKKKSSLLGEYDRLHLVELAIKDDFRFTTSSIEFKMPQPSYTIDTLTYLKEKHPEHEFSLIMGGDNLNNLHKWKNYEQILENYELMVYVREEKELPFSDHPHVCILHFPYLQISSTYIRSQLKGEGDVRYLVPQPSLDYINEMHFYKK